MEEKCQKEFVCFAIDNMGAECIMTKNCVFVVMLRSYNGSVDWISRIHDESLFRAVFDPDTTHHEYYLHVKQKRIIDNLILKGYMRRANEYVQNNLAYSLD